MHAAIAYTAMGRLGNTCSALIHSIEYSVLALPPLMSCTWMPIALHGRIRL